MSFARLACLSLGLVLAAAVSARADDKKETTRKGQLPANWGKLGLSDAQRAKVYAVQAEYKDKIDALNKQIETLRKQQAQALQAVLTKEQKARLSEIVLGEAPGAKPDRKGGADPGENKPRK